MSITFPVCSSAVNMESCARMCVGQPLRFQIMSQHLFFLFVSSEREHLCAQHVQTLTIGVSNKMRMFHTSFPFCLLFYRSIASLIPNPISSKVLLKSSSPLIPSMVAYSRKFPLSSNTATYRLMIMVMLVLRFPHNSFWLQQN